MADTPQSSGWSGTVSAFLAVPKAGWISALQEHYGQVGGSPAGPERLRTWDLEADLLAKEFKQLLQVRPDMGSCMLIFDYAPARDRQWHPDCILLAAEAYAILFISDDRVLQAHADQLAAYARDLDRIHAGSGQPPAMPVIVHTRARDLVFRDGEVIILSPNRIADFFLVEEEMESGPRIDAGAWTAAGERAGTRG